MQNCVLLEPIGHGSFGSVHKAQNRDTGALYAVKIIPKAQLYPNIERMLETEISSLKAIDSPHIVKYVKSFQSTNNFYLFLEYCEGGNLEEFLRRNGAVEEKVAKMWTKDLVCGLIAMRESSVIHRDLKLANVLLTDKDWKNAKVKLCDFGFARFATDDILARSQVGTPVCTAPEVLSGTPYDYKVDVWSLGVLLYELLVGTNPFPARNYEELKEMQQHPVLFPASRDLSPCAKALISHMLQYDPKSRPDFPTILKHPFFEEFPEPEIDMDMSNSCIHPYYISDPWSNDTELISLSQNYSKEKRPEIARVLLKVCLEKYESDIQKAKANIKRSANLIAQRDYMRKLLVETVQKRMTAEEMMQELDPESKPVLDSDLVNEAEKLMTTALERNVGNALEKLEIAALLLSIVLKRGENNKAVKLSKLCWHLKTVLQH